MQIQHGFSCCPVRNSGVTQVLRKPAPRPATQPRNTPGGISCCRARSLSSSSWLWTSCTCACRFARPAAGVTAGSILVQGETRIGNPLADRLSDRCLLLTQCSFALVQLGLKIGRRFGIPFGIVEPGFVNWKCGFGRGSGRLRRWFRRFPGRRWKSGRARAADPYRHSSRLSWADFDCLARGAASLQLAKNRQSAKQEPPRAGRGSSA